MTASARLDAAVSRLAAAFPGPGGACAVLKDGEVLAAHAWGYANAELGLAFTPKSLFRMCSITKQFTCAAVLDAVGDPAVLDAAVAARLPRLQTAAPPALRLMHNQSGLRDYWAVAMMMGAGAEDRFASREARTVIESERTLQFAPGTANSYCNQNFRILSDALEAREGRPFSEILRRRVFDRAGMETALLGADTRALPDGSEGYEGAPATGFRPAANRIVWTGDAGIAASLEDMIAWERWIDATRDDPDSLYRRLSAPVTFVDGAPASYGFGLGRGRQFGREITAHGGALRGWRSHRLYMPSERISVVVMFNHLSEAHVAAADLLGAVLGETAPAAPAGLPEQSWLGAWIDPATQLSARIDMAGEGRVRLRYGHSAEVLDLQADGSACTDSGMRLDADGAALRLDRPGENLVVTLEARRGEPAKDVAGRWRCEEIGSEIVVADAGGALYGGFAGPLGDGRMERLEPIGPDLWALPCWRALDHTPPGDFTLSFQRDGAAAPTGLVAGCWLARGLGYDRVA
ncbi:MAG TPA: D-aminopeptidase [Caulobacteraceae bacterium]|jgi:D-aminopeptidase|nr:D-aminopeptidase [Caulobacteraceae bacterium]